MPGDGFSIAQLCGYLAFALGLVCFWQKDDRRFRWLMAAQSLTYALHFLLLGRPTSATSAAVSCARSLTSLYTQAPAIAAGFIAAALGLGAWLGQGAMSFFPVVASCLGTVALFFLSGLRMRALLLVATSLWIVNDLAVRSYGGTCLEMMVFAVNLTTIGRLARAQRKPAAVRARVTTPAATSRAREAPSRRTPST